MIVEHAVAALRLAEAGVEDALTAERDARSRRNDCMREPGRAAGNWAEAESEAQIDRVLAVRRAYALPALEMEIGAAREAYLERRRERQKIENLMRQAARKEELESARRSRLEIDDLFQARRWRGWRRRDEDQAPISCPDSPHKQRPPEAC